jgi:peptidoglycan/LPS O-acetylase OafA/YrhL
MELSSIQYLRGIAALMIVFYHLEVPLQRLGYEGYWPTWLTSGVDIFFVISGFIMWVTTCNAYIGPLEFFYKRIARIVPLYWILTSILVFTILVAPSAVKSGRLDFYHVIASFLFLPATHPLLGSLVPVLVPGWTLNFEMLFYAIFGSTLAFPRVWRLLITLSLLSILAFAKIPFPADLSALAFYNSSVIGEFGLGMLLGVIFMREVRVPPMIAILCVLAGVVSIPLLSVLHTNAERFLVGGLPAFLIVAGCLFLENSKMMPSNIAMKLLGDASYSIYLSHGIALSAASQAWIYMKGNSLPFSYIWFSLSAVSCAVLLGIGIYYGVESKLNMQFRKTKYRPRPTSAQSI